MITATDITELISSWKEQLTQNPNDATLKKCIKDLEDTLYRIDMEEAMAFYDSLPSEEQEEIWRDMEADSYLSSQEFHEQYYQ